MVWTEGAVTGNFVLSIARRITSLHKLPKIQSIYLTQYLNEKTLLLMYAALDNERQPARPGTPGDGQGRHG